MVLHYTSLTAANLTGTISAAVLEQRFFIGTTAVALNRASANQALTGILSIVFPGSTSGTVTLVPQLLERLHLLCLQLLEY
jgi:hypothetical protein